MPAYGTVEVGSFLRVLLLAAACVFALTPSAPAEAAGPTDAAGPIGSAGAIDSRAGYPSMSWIPASPFNYDFGRRGNTVQSVVIHDTEISYASTIATFLNPRARKSAHYVVRGDGLIAQMIPESDAAWHAGNYSYNLRTIGIEHELDRYTNPAFTEAQYRASAKLVCAIASRYGFPLDRDHVFGHAEVPGTTHTDPGPTWNWPHYMWLLSQCADARTISSAFHSRWVGQIAPDEIPVGGVATAMVRLRNAGTVDWVKGGDREARLGIVGDDTRFAGLGIPHGWLASTRPAAQQEAFVPPGGIATFIFQVSAWRPGVYRLPLRPVIDGVTWMEAQGIHLDVVVR